MKNQKLKIKNQKLFVLFSIIILGSLFFLPLVSLAGEYIVNGKTVTYKGLVPCGGPNELPCQLCHLFVLLDRIVDFTLFYIVFPLATLLLVISGGTFLLSAGNPATITQGRLIMTSVIIGLVIIFAAWLIINTFFMALGLSEFGLKLTGPDKWVEIKCPIGEMVAIPPPAPTETPQQPTPQQPTPQQPTLPPVPTELPPPKLVDRISNTLTPILASPIRLIRPSPTPPDGQFNYNPNVLDQRTNHASPELIRFIDCMAKRVPGNVGRISSISGRAGYARCTHNWSRPPCPHMRNSCHYGGIHCKHRGSFALDFSDQENLQELRSAALQCEKKAFVLGKIDHVHISIGWINGCGCN